MYPKIFAFAIYFGKMACVHISYVCVYAVHFLPFVTDNETLSRDYSFVLSQHPSKNLSTTYTTA